MKAAVGVGALVSVGLAVGYGVLATLSLLLGGSTVGSGGSSSVSGDWLIAKGAGAGVVVPRGRGFVEEWG